MFNFFSNNIIYVDGEQIERIDSPAGSREDIQEIFEAPNHTVGTQNLLVFVDGALQISGQDYVDYNSSSIKFKNYIGTTKNVVIIVIKGNSDFEWGYF